MKITINEVKPTPPPKTYTLELSQEEMDVLRYLVEYVDRRVVTTAAIPAQNRFFNLTLNCAGNTWKPDDCFRSKE